METLINHIDINKGSFLKAQLLLLYDFLPRALFATDPPDKTEGRGILLFFQNV